MLKIANLNKYFNRGKKNQIKVINDTSLELPNQGLVALLGPSGCGKTTLLNVIGGLDKVQSGNVYINNNLVTSKMAYQVDKIRNLNVGYIFQDYKLIEDMTVYENVAIVLKMLGIKDKKEIGNRVDYVLEKLNMLRYKRRPVSMLSGGERQRVGIARALVKNPNVILADEPTGNLDSKNSLEIMNIIKNISKERLVILVTHERDLADFYASRIIELVDGKVVKDYENKHDRELDYRIDNKIYLKDFKNHEVVEKDNVTVNLYSDNKENINLNIVFKNGNIYIESHNDGKLEIIDDESSIELVNEKYKKIEQKDVDNYDFNLDDIVDKKINYKYSSIYNPWTMVVNGFKKVANFSILKKILLIGFFVSGMFIMYAISSICATINIKDSDFIKYNRNYLNIISKNNSVDDYLNLEKREDINYILPGDSSVVFVINYNDYYQTINMSDNLSGSLSSIKMISEKNLISGIMPSNKYEIIVDKMTIQKMFSSSQNAKMSGITSYEELLNRNVRINNLSDFKIVGICDLNSPSIYTDDSLFINIIANSKGGTAGYINGYAIENYYENEMADYDLLKESIKITKGRYPKNDYEVVVSSDLSLQYELNKDTDMKVNDHKLRVVGYFSGNNTYRFLVNNNTIMYQLITTKSNLTIYSNNKKLTLNDLQKERINIVDSYDKAKNDYYADNYDYIRGSLIAAGIILAISLIEIFLMIRSSFLSRIKEVGILRAIGIKKIDIYKMFFGEILAISLIASIPGILFMAYILENLSSSINYISRLYMINPLIVLLSVLFILLFNAVVGLLPVFEVIIKRPARILARHDID